MAKQEQDHRHGMQNRGMDSEISQAARGQWMAFIISIVAMGCGSWLVSLGHQWGGGATVFVGISILAGKFLKLPRDASNDHSIERESTD